MRNILLSILTAALLSWTCAAQDYSSKAAAKSDAGKITSHSQGLHGYIGFGHENLPPQSAWSAGMGFYAAVWPLVDQPLADFQIGLPSSWITPDNSDNKDKPLAPEGTLAAMAGAAFIGALGAAFRSDAKWIAVAFVAGTLGSLLDSLLGATVQAIYYSDRRGKETENQSGPYRINGDQTDDICKSCA